jgi:hypothetical protein
MVLYKTLKITHPDYNKELIIKNELLYEGGQKLSAHADLFLPRDSDESDEFYAERCSTAYDPIFNNTLERFKALLFSTPMTIVPSAVTNDPATKSKALPSDLEDFLHEFERNCDGKGTSLHNFTKQAFLTALKQSHALTMVDFPRIAKEAKASNYQGQLDNGELNGYLVDVPLCNVINWQRDELGNLLWLTIFVEQQFRVGPLEPLKCLYRWTTVALENGVVVLHVYEKVLNLDENETLEDEDEVPEVDTVKTSFPELNIAEMCMSPGLALGNIIGPACEQLFRTDSIINAAAQRNVIFSLPILMAGNNMNAAAGDGRRAINITQMNPNRFGQGPQVAQKQGGWMLIGNQDDAKMLESEGKGLAALQEQKKVIIERINASVHQVAQNIQARGTQNALSAAAKQEDRRDTEIILNEFKLVVETYVLKIISLLLSLRKQTTVSLHMEGLNVEDDIDRDQILKEVQAYGQFPQAEIFKVNFQYNAAIGLLGDDLDDDDKVELRSQIEDSVKKEAFQPQESANPQQPGASPLSSSNNSSPNSSDPASDPPEQELQNGKPVMPEGAHLSSDQHVDANVVYNQLADDYKAKDIKFVLQIPWLDQSMVPLSSIDFSNKDNWQATQEEDKVQEFADKITDGFEKPIILVNNKSNNNKMQIVDGHHRALAYLKLGQAAHAYVGLIGSDRGPWDKLHSKQVATKLEQSQQAEVSNQVQDSEEA